MACSVKLCLRFSAHVLFLAVNELQKEDKAKYKRKLTLTNGQLLPDLYGIVENMKSDVKLMPDVSWGNIYKYLVNSPSEYTYDNVKAWKLFYVQQ